MPLNVTTQTNPPAGNGGHWELWIDRGGGFDILQSDRVTIGGPGGDCTADISIRSAMRSLVAVIVRGESGDAIEIESGDSRSTQSRLAQPLSADQWLPLDNVSAGKPTGQNDGTQPRLRYRRPSPLSRSAVITVAPPHRLVRPVDATILFDQTILIGPESYNHVCIETLSSQGWVLFRRDGLWWIRGRNTPGQVIELGRPWRHDDWSMMMKQK